ncbi:MAG TPA: HEAT repeat domain-containing protein, partial [Planctomycetaceae bacterium]|nr:HEAT repeat domain-containing protein [Planctomycetaceae bacterium]
HMQHHIRDPNRDKVHGRVYRVTHLERPLIDPPAVAGEPIPKLLELLKQPEDRLRYRVRIELSGRKTPDVIQAVRAWVARLDREHPDYEHHLLEALWVHQVHNVVDAELLGRVLSSPDHRARAAATRALSWWRDRVPESLALLNKLAADEHPRVRLEAVRAASYFTVPEAVEVPLIAMERPTDEYLDFARGETMKALEPHWKRALAEGRRLELTSPAGMRFLLRNVSTDELLKMPRSQAVFLEMLYRAGLQDEHRREALRGLAQLEGQPELNVLLDAIRNLDDKQQDQSVVFDLVRLLTGRSPRELAGIRGELEQMAVGAQLPVVRQVGFVALITADGNVDPAWKLAVESVSRLHDLVSAMPLIPDPSVRAGLAPKVEPLLHKLPEHLAGDGGGSKGTFGRYVRIELPRRGTLTLAEVEVLSDGRNVARQGKASQKNTAHGGEAGRAIDGITSAIYGRGGQTHTEENTNRPWWELDLEDEVPIEAIVVHNRREGDLGQRLDGFTLKVLDSSRHDVFVQRDIPAPQARVAFALGGSGPEGLIRRAAMTALTYVRGRETETFKALAGFVQSGTDRVAAIRAMQRIPRSYWPPDQAAPLVESILGYVRSVPEQERRSPAVLESLQLGDALASLLPADQAKQVRSELGELGVAVVRLGTLPHRMAYDKDRLVVRAGKPVEIIFENIDLMPHNLVVLQPGSLEEIGAISDATAQQRESAEREYVPASDKVLLASRLLQPRDVQTLSWTAPTQPGVYPYVCTYPGHWRRMYGALYVVEDVDAYLADPEAYLASSVPPARDEMLKHIRPRTEWKLADLEPDLAHLEHGRSFGGGKQMFQVANCVGCHKLNGVGNVFGPDLAKLDPMFKPADILKELLDPSARINEKFQTQVFVTEAGKTVTGLVLEEGAEQIKVIENPLAGTEPVVLKRGDIIERQKSPTSIMPKGLLDKLSREEILDLIAYVYARGDQRHKLFEGGEGHHHHHGH